MFDPPSSAFAAGVDSFVLAAVLLAFGYLLADAALSGRDVDRVTRWGLALPCLIAYALVLMLLHIITRGGVLSNAWLVRGLTLSLLFLLAVRKLKDRPLSDRKRGAAPAAWAMVALTLLGVALWCVPIFRLLPIDVTGDNNQHMGWTGQLLNGEPTPSVGLIAEVPNSYPWLYHATTAVIANLIPGGRPYHTQGAWQMLQVVGMILALFGLGRQINGRLVTGSAAALFGSMTGGVGFFLVDKIDLVLRSRRDGGASALQYMGDLLNERSYNVAFHNLAPAFPRDVNYSLLCAFLLVLVLGLSRRSMPILVGSGVVLGMIGLMGAESFFVAFAIAVIAVLIAPRIPRVKSAASVLGPALALYAFWLVPTLVSYLRLGGFKNTANAPVALPPLAILVSWGVVTPFAIVGFLRWLPKLRSDAGATVVAAAAAASATIILTAALIPALLGPGFTTLGYQHRYWPLLYIAFAVYAALGVTLVLDRFFAIRPALAAVSVLVIIALAIPSPLIGTLSLPHTLGETGLLRPLVAHSLRGEDNTLLNQLSPHPPSYQCRVAAPIELTSRTFSYTGFRHVMYSRTRKINAFVRFRDIYERIIPKEERIRDNALLTGGTTDTTTWNALVAKYDVNLVIVEESRAGSEPHRQHPMRGPTGPADGTRYFVIQVDKCP